MERYFEIGKVAGTHGLKGTLRVFPTTDDPTRYELLKSVIIELNGKKETYTITNIAYHKKFVLVTTKELQDINLAELLKGATLLIPESEALPLDENEYYTRDLYGVKVFTDEDEFLGSISNIYETGANDVYGIVNEDVNDGKELLIPAIKQCILKVDIKEQKMIVKLLDGLRDLD